MAKQEQSELQVNKKSLDDSTSVIDSFISELSGYLDQFGQLTDKSSEQVTPEDENTITELREQISLLFQIIELWMQERLENKNFSQVMVQSTVSFANEHGDDQEEKIISEHINSLTREMIECLSVSILRSPLFTKRQKDMLFQNTGLVSQHSEKKFESHIVEAAYGYLKSLSGLSKVDQQKALAALQKQSDRHYQVISFLLPYPEFWQD